MFEKIIFLKIVQTELSFYRDTHKADVIQQPDLFKLNKPTASWSPRAWYRRFLPKSPFFSIFQHKSLQKSRPRVFQNTEPLAFEREPFVSY